MMLRSLPHPALRSPARADAPRPLHTGRRCSIPAAAAAGGVPTPEELEKMAADPAMKAQLEAAMKDPAVQVWEERASEDQPSLCFRSLLSRPDPLNPTRSPSS